MVAIPSPTIRQTVGVIDTLMMMKCFILAIGLNTMIWSQKIYQVNDYNHGTAVSSLLLMEQD